MNIVLSGRFENALFREVTAHPNRKAITTEHPYYQSLYRYTPYSYFERCGTFIVISDRIELPMVDWTFRQSGVDRGITEDDFGLTPVPLERGEWSHDIQTLAAFALTRRAFPRDLMRILSTVVGPGDHPPPANRSTVRQIGTVDGFALHHLCRLLLQVNFSAARGAYLVIGDEEHAILRALGDFVVSEKIPTPFALPDLDLAKTVHADEFASGLLNFSPPDALAVAAVRASSEIAEYARKVRRCIEEQEGEEFQRGLIRAMREAYEKNQKSKAINRAFEITSLVAKPLHYIPGLDALMTVGEDVLDAAKKWIERKEIAQDWRLIGAKMQEISVDDYLKRKGNI